MSDAEALGLLVTARDEPGMLYRISEAIFRRGANITYMSIGIPKAIEAAVGAAAIDLFTPTFLLFGLLLIWTAIQLVRHRNDDPDPDDNPLLRYARRILPTTADMPLALGPGSALALAQANAELNGATNVVVRNSDLLDGLGARADQPASLTAGIGGSVTGWRLHQWRRCSNTAPWCTTSRSGTPPFPISRRPASCSTAPASS